MEKAAADREFEQLYRSTYRYLTGYVLARIRDLDDTDDLLQTVYSSFYRRILSKGSLDEVSARKLLTTSAKHELSRYYGLRKKERGLVALDDERTRDHLEGLLAQEVPDFAGDDALLLATLWREIESQGDLTRRLFLLHFQLGYTLRETAEALGISEAAATSRLYRAIGRLRDKFPAEKEVQP